MAVACDLCKKTFMNRSLVNRHKRQVHKLNTEKLMRGRPRGTAFTCAVCSWSTANQRLLIQHQHSEHENNKYKIEVHCPVENCSHWFHTRQELCNHVLFVHADEIPEGSSITEMYFSNIEEFKEWKANKEAETSTKYILTRAPKAQKTGIVYRYFCHRSGAYVGKGRGIRHLKLKGTCKIGRTCPAMITVQNQNSLVHVVFSDVHYGHCSDVINTHLSKGEQEQIAKRLSENIPFESILKNVKDNLDSKQTTGSFILQGHTISSAMHDFELDVDKSNESGVESVAVWAEELARTNDKAVLYLKFQGTADEIHTLNEEDFVLVIMTDIQKGMLLKFGKNCFICVDRIYAYDLSVTTLVVVDDYKEGFPVAFCYSNRGDYSVLKCFFNVVKLSVKSAIPVKFLMTDDDDSVYDTWVEVMGSPENRLLCSWHVDKIWRKTISSNLQASDELKIRIYKHLRMLLHCEDIHNFYLELDDFLSTCGYRDATKDFGEYFHRHYVSRCEQWAYCYRIGLCINPSMHIEVFHKVLKQMVISGLKLGKVGKSINALMAILRPRVLFRRLMKLKNEKLAKAVQQINQRHAESLALDLEGITIDDNGWKVNIKDESYRVKREAVATNHVNCKLKCTECDICFHDFSCTCSDYSLHCTICKHIHLVNRMYITSPPLVGNEVEVNAQGSCETDNFSSEFDDHIVTKCTGHKNNEFESHSSNPSSELGEIDHMINQLKAKMLDSSIINNPTLVSHIHQSLSTLLTSLCPYKAD